MLPIRVVVTPLRPTGGVVTVWGASPGFQVYQSSMLSAILSFHSSIITGEQRECRAINLVWNGTVVSGQKAKKALEYCPGPASQRGPRFAPFLAFPCLSLPVRLVYLSRTSQSIYFSPSLHCWNSFPGQPGYHVTRTRSRWRQFSSTLLHQVARPSRPRPSSLSHLLFSHYQFQSFLRTVSRIVLDICSTPEHACNSLPHQLVHAVITPAPLCQPAEQLQPSVE